MNGCSRLLVVKQKNNQEKEFKKMKKLKEKLTDLIIEIAGALFVVYLIIGAMVRY